MKSYKLIVQGDTSFSISNETDTDIMTDYMPGIWSIGSQRRALKYAKEYLNEGNTVHVSCYNAKHYPTANKMIQELGIKQELFDEPKLPVSDCNNGKPQNLSQFKKYVNEGVKFRIVHHKTDGDTERVATVLKTGGSYFTCTKNETEGIMSPVWTEYGKANDWSFHNDHATSYFVRDGVYVPASSYYYHG